MLSPLSVVAMSVCTTAFVGVKDVVETKVFIPLTDDAFDVVSIDDVVGWDVTTGGGTNAIGGTDLERPNFAPFRRFAVIKLISLKETERKTIPG